MALPQSREEFKQNCLRLLGHPVLKINVDNLQVEDRIDDAISFWQDYHHDATRKVYLRHQITQQNIDDDFVILPDNVISVSRVFPASFFQSLNLYNQQFLIDLADAARIDTTSYYLAMQKIAGIEHLLTSVPVVTFQRHGSRLSFEGDNMIGKRFKVDEFIAIEAYAIIDPEETASVWSNRILRDLAAAYIKKQWGMNIKKFSGIQLPGGVTLDGERMYSDALQEIENVERDFIQRYQDPDIFLVG